jgi:hypothetical protein
MSYMTRVVAVAMLTALVGCGQGDKSAAQMDSAAKSANAAQDAAASSMDAAKEATAAGAAAATDEAKALNEGVE